MYHIWCSEKNHEIVGGLVDNYIIRVYRYKINNPQKFVGTVEKVGLKMKLSFTNYEELWEILNAPGYGRDDERCPR